VSRWLISLGASASHLSRDGQSAASVAAGQGHENLAGLLTRASHVAHSPREPPVDTDPLPGSNLWKEARETRVEQARRVAYGGGVVMIPAGTRCFEDDFGRTLIGWHATYDPPAGMDDDSMVCLQIG
jgi:hypothetical protein